MTEACALCGGPLAAGEALVLVRGRRQQAHCSEECLSVSLRRHRLKRRAAQRRWGSRVAVVAFLLVAVPVTWRHFQAPQAVSISFDWIDSPPDEPPAASRPLYGPPWPPSDADWLKIFATGSWVYPLPGPKRRPPTADARIYGPAPRGHQPFCRTLGRCGVDLGGELWGEHVYAALDGEVDHVQATGNAGHGGLYVRLSHFGGYAFTHYFHLAGTPRTLKRGARVRAGDVIGLLGDTGLSGQARHLHFALSIRPSPAYADVYWDPTPLMAGWPLRLPPHGTVAGFSPTEPPLELTHRRRGR